MKIKKDKKSVGELLKYFARTTDEIFSLEELKKMLLSGKQLRMKFGIDVTAPNLHIGHAVNFWMYRKMQELGHKMVFLIGDFTTTIGDPTGKNKARPVIPEKEIKRNSEKFIKQAMKVLHKEPKLVEIRRNSEWYGKMSAAELLSLMSLVTHSRLINRDMFQERLEKKQEIYGHELMYPILQGYDSVMLKSNITIVGSDQLYNELMGRFFQERFNQVPQVIVTTKITPGIDGQDKQSKSLGNYIGLTHSPREKFGRVMSISDKLIVDYFKVYTEAPLKEIAVMEKNISKGAMDYKLHLAWEIVKRYHGEKIAERELEWFQKTFSRREVPDNIPEVKIGKTKAPLFEIVRKCFSEKEKSNSQLRRLIGQGAVKIEGKIIKNASSEETITKQGLNVKVGKRNWFKAVL